MSPKVSVVIPVFNRRVTVRRAIESVLAQTCQDFEIIVVDDGSTDATAASVAALADHRITLIRHERNRGGSAARNTGIRASSGPYVAFLDSDDAWLPAKLERQLEMFERSSDRVGLVYTGAERIYADGSISQHIPRRHANLVRPLLSLNVIGGTSVGMVRRDVLETLGGFDESLPSSQDLDLWFRVFELFGIAFVPEVLVRIASGNDRGRITANIDGVVKGRELFCRKHRNKMQQHGVLHLYLRYSGWVYLRMARDATLARRRYLEALAVNPISAFTYVLLLGACLPMSWLDAMARWKHGMTALLQSAYVAVHGTGSPRTSHTAPEKRTK
jgi:glycosyltransferase involved in cell wall biosynthesis